MGSLALRDAERHRVKGNGPDGKKSGDDQPVELEDDLAGALIEEAHQAKAPQLAERPPVEAWSKADPGEQLPGDNDEQQEARDVDGDRETGHPDQSPAQLHRRNLDHRIGGRQDDGADGKQVEPLKTLRDRAKEGQDHVAGEADRGDVQDNSRGLAQLGRHIQNRMHDEWGQPGEQSRTENSQRQE